MGSLLHSTWLQALHDEYRRVQKVDKRTSTGGTHDNTGKRVGETPVCERQETPGPVRGMCVKSCCLKFRYSGREDEDQRVSLPDLLL